jgi:predicted dehydrogenase
LQDGIIGDLICSRVYWNNPGVWVNPRTTEQSELEFQMRNWYYFNWLCGDHIVEQHIHNIDVINWLLDDYPQTAQGQGGRLVRTGPEHGQIFDHHAVEFTYSNGHKMFSHCRHMPGCWSEVAEFVHGSKGYADISSGKIFDKDDKRIFTSNGSRDGHQQEHHDLFADFAAGKRPNETEYGAKSTMTAIFGRLATYSGKELNWQKAINSKISLANIDALHALTDEAPVQPNSDGGYPIPVPGTGADQIIDF